MWERRKTFTTERRKSDDEGKEEGQDEIFKIIDL